MFGVGERIDRRDAGVMGEFFHIALCERAEDRAVDHASHDASGVFDGFAATELDVGRAQKHGATAEFAHADFKRDASARRGLGEDQRPSLACERFGFVRTASPFHPHRISEDQFHVRPGQFFYAQ